MTVLKALRRQPIFMGCGPTAADNVVRRLREGGWLQSAWLYDRYEPDAVATALPSRYSYYHLTPAAANLLGEHPDTAMPLKDEPKVRAYAVLAFCCLHEPRQEKLTPHEYVEMFPEFHRVGERINYYIDVEGPRKRLGYLRVDYGGQGRWDRIVDKCRDDVRKRCDNEHFRQVVLRGDFVITVITALEQKAVRLRVALEEAELPCEIKVHVVPDLLEMIAPGPPSTRHRRID